jgi:hypothetical protein
VGYNPATHLDDGKLLRALSTTLAMKVVRGTRLIAVYNGNKERDWMIRRRVPKSAIAMDMEPSQRLNGCGFSVKV